MEMIRFAKWEDARELQALWHSTFFDTVEYIQNFFAHCFSPERALVLTCAGKILSAMYFLPMASLSEFGGKSFTCGYGYAFATRSDVRGKGYGTRLFKQAELIFAERGVDFFLLHPASDALCLYYKKMGYLPFFSLEERVCENPKIKGKGRLQRVSPKTYNAWRRKFLAGRIFVDYEENLLLYLSRLLGEMGGGLFTFSIAGEIGCAAIGRSEKGEIFLHELLTQAEEIEPIIGLISAYFPAERYRVRRPAESGTPYTMLKAIGKKRLEATSKNGYFPFVFD